MVAGMVVVVLVVMGVAFVAVVMLVALMIVVVAFVSVVMLMALMGVVVAFVSVIMVVTFVIMVVAVLVALLIVVVAFMAVVMLVALMSVVVAFVSVVMLVTMLMTLMSVIMAFVTMVMVMPTTTLLFLVAAAAHFLQHIVQHGIALLNDFKQLFSVQAVHRRGNDDGLGILPADHVHVQLDLGGVGDVRAAEHDGSGVLNLVVEEFAEILHVHLTLVGVHNGHGAVQLHLHIRGHVDNGLHHVGELAHARRLDDDAVRLVLGQNLFQGFSEIAHQ